MSKKPRLSAQDKRDAILSIFHETSDVFVLKDIEKIGSKQKGINSMLIKEILQSLVDDGLVRMEKIGISNYYWSFPSEASTKLQNEEAQLKAEVQRVEQKAERLSKALEQEREIKEQTDEHRDGMQQIKELRARIAQQEAELRECKASDPELLQTMREGAKTAQDAANRWLDNIYCLMTWCKKTFPGQEEALLAFFKENGYSDDLDYI